MLKIIEKNISKIQKGELERFGQTVTKMGGNFAVCDAAGQLLLDCNNSIFGTSWQQIIDELLINLDKLRENVNGKSFQIRNNVLGVFLKLHSQIPAHIALIDMGEMVSPQNICDKPANEGYTTRANDYPSCEIFSEMLKLLAERFQSETKSEEQAEMFSIELSQVYEELALIYKLSTNMKISSSYSSYLQMACDCLRDIVNVEGIVILLEKNVDDERCWVLSAGAGIIDLDEELKKILHNRLVKEIGNGKEGLLDSEVDTPFKYDWPDYIKNIIAVPLYGKNRSTSNLSETGQNDNRIIGLMAAVNRMDKPDFDSVDIKLFNSVANGCAVFVENVRLFGDLKELFIGSLKALTSSIDAKDQYTRGHSERVAFISQWIAERYAEHENIEDELIHNIYLTGLLHDIGKIGVSETVLCKKGKLTEDELNYIRRHPIIGANILNEIKQMRPIVPGVLYHHERMDGKGYPNGLTDDKIPLSGKIIGLADSFDAMTSARVYRKALSLDEALDEIRKGLGTQFDVKVGTIFLQSNIYQLWDFIQDGLGETYKKGEFSEYGTKAVGTLVK